MKTFEPTLALSREPDSQYTLRAITLMPNACYSAGRAEVGVPPSVRLIAEVLPVLLHVRSRKGPSLQVITPVRHRIRDLDLGAKHGKNSVLAFVMLNGTVAGSASVRVDEPGTGVNEEPRPIDTADWYAWNNRMPPGPASFHVIGTVVVGHPGIDARLVRAEPQGINPAELILDLVLTERPGFWPQVVTSLNVRHDEPSPAAAYKGVLVRIPGGEAVHLEVEDVF